MADSIVSQFQREYALPIETTRQVSTISQRDAISTLRRWEGMLVYVVTEGVTYILQGGTDNTSWISLVGLSDAPVDGQSYIRKDGAWSILPAGLPDAPSDGETYGRKDGAWSIVSGAVISVFSRTGAVTAQEADYGAFYAKLSEDYANPSWIASLEWSKITGISLATVATSGSYDDLADKPDEEDIMGSVETASVSGTKNLDLAAYSAFYYTLTAATTLTNSGLPASGKTFVRTLLITGNYALTYPTGWTRKAGVYVGTKMNLITVSFVNNGSSQIDVIITQTN